MNIKTLLIVISLALLIWLFIDNLNQLDIVPVKNDSLINSKKIEIDKMQQIDSVKIYAKATLDLIRTKRINNSEKAIIKNSVIGCLFFIQLLVLAIGFYKRKTMN